MEVSVNSLFLECLKIAAMASIIGYVYAAILIQPGEILHWLYSFFQKKLTKITTTVEELPEELRAIQQPKIIEHRREHWLLKPLGACEKCSAGQAALWIFLVLQKLPKLSIYNYSIFTVHLIFTICLAILLTVILKKSPLLK